MAMMPPTGTPFDFVSAASAAGSLLSGLGGIFGGGGVSANKQRGMLRDQYSEAQRNARQMPSDIVTGMRNAGLHPLVGFGGGFQPSMASGTIGGSDSGPDLGAVGEGITRAATAFTGRAERELAGRSAELSVQNQELQNEYIRTQIRHMNAPGTPPGFSGNSIDGQGDSLLAQAKAAIASMDTPLGNKQGANPLHKIAYDERGDAIRMFNEEDLGDNDIAQIAHFLRYTVPDYWHSKVTRPAGRGLRNIFKSGKAAGRSYNRTDK